jgi:hypothetical protein
MFSSTNYIRMTKSKMVLAEHVARICKSRGIYRHLVDKFEGTRLLGRPTHVLEVNIKIELHEV